MQDTIDKARAILDNDVRLYEDVCAAYASIQDAIETRAATATPKPKVFEVHHEMVIARHELVSAIADGLSAVDAKAKALARIGL